MVNMKMTGINNIGDVKGTGSIFLYVLFAGIIYAEKVSDDRYNNKTITWPLICLFLKFR